MWLWIWRRRFAMAVRGTSEELFEPNWAVDSHDPRKIRKETACQWTSRNISSMQVEGNSHRELTEPRLVESRVNSLRATGQATTSARLWLTYVRWCFLWSLWASHRGAMQFNRASLKPPDRWSAPDSWLNFHGDNSHYCKGLLVNKIRKVCKR